ncbi:DUF1269 domain-containing protein [Kitasatospora sp. NPDC051914]|uniref:DUF1269 domain-containing protein n=1 Tax=Kitasatospora sp. NPDC051914 TaxID=3154945 RepID=UPI00343D0C74
MAALTVWRFPTSEGAQAALDTLQDLQRQELITVQDGAVVSWPESAKKPKTRRLSTLTGMGALGGTFWGLLIGMLFFVPVLGMAMGAAAGATAGHFAHFGIDDDFIEQVRERVTPGTSALFVLSSHAVLDKVRPAFEGLQAELIETNLTAEQEAQLRETFTEED